MKIVGRGDAQPELSSIPGSLHFGPGEGERRVAESPRGHDFETSRDLRAGHPQKQVASLRVGKHRNWHRFNIVQRHCRIMPLDMPWAFPIRGLNCSPRFEMPGRIGSDGRKMAVRQAV